jgi:hypothetical protein
MCRIFKISINVYLRSASAEPLFAWIHSQDSHCCFFGLNIIFGMSPFFILSPNCVNYIFCGAASAVLTFSRLNRLTTINIQRTQKMHKIGTKLHKKRKKCCVLYIIIYFFDGWLGRGGAWVFPLTHIIHHPSFPLFHILLAQSFGRPKLSFRFPYTLILFHPWYKALVQN